MTINKHRVVALFCVLIAFVFVFVIKVFGQVVAVHEKFAQTPLADVIDILQPKPCLGDKRFTGRLFQLKPTSDLEGAFATEANMAYCYVMDDDNDRDAYFANGRSCQSLGTLDNSMIKSVIPDKKTQDIDETVPSKKCIMKVSLQDATECNIRSLADVFNISSAYDATCSNEIATLRGTIEQLTNDITTYKSLISSYSNQYSQRAADNSNLASCQQLLKACNDNVMQLGITSSGIVSETTSRYNACTLRNDELAAKNADAAQCCLSASNYKDLYEQKLVEIDVLNRLQLQQCTNPTNDTVAGSNAAWNTLIDGLATLRTTSSNCFGSTDPTLAF